MAYHPVLLNDPTIRAITQPTGLSQIQDLATERFGDMVKGVVDVERRSMAIGGELHSDGEAILISQGSAQVNLWGINLYPGQYGEEDWIEFDSMINVRPSQGNRSRSVEDSATRATIRQIVEQLVTADG